jgi:hypothetical protein
MTQLAQHKADLIAIADGISSYVTLDFSDRNFTQAIVRLEEEVYRWEPKSARASHRLMSVLDLPSEVRAAAQALYELCLQQPHHTDTFVYVHKNRNISKLADNVLSSVFHHNKQFLKNNDELHGQITFSVVDVLKLVMLSRIVSQFEGTLFEADDRPENPQGYLLSPRSYGDLVDGSMLSRIMRQGYGNGARTMITVLAKFTDTTDLQADLKFAFDEMETFGLKVSGYVVFNEPNVSKVSYTRPGSVLLQTCIDHATMEESIFFTSMNEMFKQCVGGDYPRFDDSPQSRVACALSFTLKLAKASVTSA